MIKHNFRKYFFLPLKIIISVSAIWFVFSKIETGEMAATITSCKWGFLLPAVLLFAVSKALSATRLNIYFSGIGLNLSEKSNFRLYLTGMFYNLFLPGGIGGDGYKIYLLYKNSKCSLKRITEAVILDRASGLLIIIIMVFSGITLFPEAGKFRYMGIAAAIITFLSYFIYTRLIATYFRKNDIKTFVYSAVVQGLQVLSVFFIALALGINSGFPQQIIIFLISSAVSVLPFTIGGIGAREIVFLYGYKFLGLDESAGVAISMLFFIITATVSLTGIYYAVTNPQIELK